MSLTFHFSLLHLPQQQNHKTMISSTQIKAAINSQYLPNTGEVHMYFPFTENGRKQAEWEASAAGVMYFASLIQGVKMYSVRIKQKSN